MRIFLVSVVVILLSQVVSPVFAGQTVVVRKGQTLSTLDKFDAGEEPKEIGVTVESGLSLTSEQLAKIVDKKESILLNQSVKPLLWSDFIDLEYEATSTEQISLVGNEIRKVNHTVVTKYNKENFSFLLLTVFGIFGFASCLFVIKTKKPEAKPEAKEKWVFFVFLGLILITIPLVTIEYAGLGKKPLWSVFGLVFSMGVFLPIMFSYIEGKGVILKKCFFVFTVSYLVTCVSLYFLV